MDFYSLGHFQISLLGLVYYMSGCLPARTKIKGNTTPKPAETPKDKSFPALPVIVGYVLLEEPNELELAD